MNGTFNFILYLLRRVIFNQVDYVDSRERAIHEQRDKEEMDLLCPRVS